MRTFYLFQVKQNILKNYKYNYEELYNMLESVYTKKTEDILVAYNIFKSLVNEINKDEYNDYIKKRNIGSENYIYYNYTHSINDYYFNETTKLIINNSHIKIETNKNVPSFFRDLKNFDNLFVIDFENHDYFILNDVISYSLH